ncbi:MAG: signal recognition particle-docking protein FtsY [Magnetococcales bacterium]|nr:signal recognition particle-docking protein FtsY [Magnetococcales bacterium]
MFKKKKGLFSRLKAGLSKTRKGFVEKMDAIITGGTVDDELIEDLETLLITSDFGMETTQGILNEAQANLKRRERNDAESLRQAIRDAIRDRLAKHQKPIQLSEDKPHMILVVGVNGVGKTTTIGKVAALFSQEGKKVMLAAGDTFRAAAVEQLNQWGERANCPVISQGENADSASVIFDAHASAQAKGMDILIADTAGRLHTKSNLMAELEKIKRVLSRQNERAPQDIWLVLDATTGQNAISQVQQFHKAMGLTGLILTKLDGTAKGGVVVGICEQFDIPVHFIGVGEGVDDLRPFDADAFVDALFDKA